MQLADATRVKALVHLPVRDLLERENDVLEADLAGANLADANRAFQQAQKAKVTFTERYRSSFRAQSSMISLRWSQVMLQM